MSKAILMQISELFYGFSYSLVETYGSCAQKNRLNETDLLSTRIINSVRRFF